MRSNRRINRFPKKIKEEKIMKHIKLYEDLNSYYQSITQREFNEYFYRKDNISLNAIDKKNLYELDKHGEYSLVVIPRRIMNGESTICGDFLISTTSNDLIGQIYKTSDEWFLVEMTISIPQIPYNNGRFPNHIYYKCDQLEGLIHFLKKLKIR